MALIYIVPKPKFWDGPRLQSLEQLCGDDAPAADQIQRLQEWGSYLETDRAEIKRALDTAHQVFAAESDQRAKDIAAILAGAGRSKDDEHARQAEWFALEMLRVYDRCGNEKDFSTTAGALCKTYRQILSCLADRES